LSLFELQDKPMNARATTRAKVLVMIPAGQRYGHDNVRIYDQPRAEYRRRYFNTGDMMVYDSTLKLLDFADLDVLKISGPTPADINRYNAGFDFAFLRGSNFIHEHMNWERASEVLAELRIPVHPIGVGAQAERRRPIALSEASKRVWRLIAERCRSIGVRGAFTAQTLREIGIANSDIVGCPSLFRRRERNLSLRLKPPAEVQRVAFSLRRETSQVYAVDQAAFVRRQRDLLLRLANAYDVTVTIHGEPEEKAFFDRDEAGIDAATERLRALGWFTEDTEQKLSDIYRRRLFLADAVEQYDAMVTDVDFAIGYRVHGILPALANGIPGILVTYDTRSEELAETLSIPTVRDSELEEIADVRELYRPERFKMFENNFRDHYDRMRAYLERNEVPHRM
jgi:hypothetical protein